MNILKAHNQWANRPAEESFWDIPEMLTFSRSVKERAVESTVELGDLRVEAAGGDLRLIGRQGVPAVISNYAFGQLSARAHAPAGYLRSLPPTLAAQNLNHGLKEIGNQSALKTRLLLHRNTDAQVNEPSLMLRAALSERYSRVWNAELIEKVADVLPAGWRPPPARPSPNTARTRTATADDISRLSQHNLLAVREGDVIGPSGLYASDKDMFMFLINENDAISDGTEHPLFRGMMLWNSEVGDMSVGGMLFLMKSVCGNLIAWDSKQVFEFNFRHIGSVSSRTNRALEVEVKKYADSSANEQVAKIEVAKRTVIAATKTEVVDAVLAFARTKKLAGLTESVLNAAYDKAEEHSDWYGVSPRTVYGMVNGLTEVSQKLSSHTDDRVALDRASGRILEMAF